MNKWDIYKILIQNSQCWPQEGQRLHWQFHVDIPKGKKQQGHSDIFAPHVLFLALIFGLNEREKWLLFKFHRKSCLDIKEKSTYRTWRRVCCTLHE